MKMKFTALLLALCMLLFTACTAATETLSVPEASPEAEPVDRTENIVITKDTLERLELNISVMSRKLQLYNVTENPDGSCTVHMTKEEQNAILSALRTALDEEMDALVLDRSWPFLERVKISEDGLSAQLYTKAEVYDPVRDRTCAEAIYLPALLYTAFTQPELAADFSMQFTVLDETDRIIDFFKYPKKEVQPSASPEAAEEAEPKE